VIGTVDYLLKLQQSIRDFYWHHSHHDSLELPARESFCVSFRVATQLFRTLTEFIQGPCIGNQDVLAKSRLWDAMSGFLQVFVALQHKLFKHVNHIELLREMLGLQEEMFVLMISLLEGSTTSSSVGQHMLSMFEECYEQVNQLMTFYYIFIKLKDATTSKAFKEYDLNKDGLISYHEFEKAMNAQQHYTKQEIDYLLQLADTNKDGLLDYQEFTERFHQPTHNLGFHICALIQQLSDILPGDKRLEKFHEICSELFRHFESNLGCIELMGRSGRIERVYFHIKSSHAKQWEDQGIKEARQQFLYSLDMKSQMEKLTGFVNFCEETIYQMNYTNEILGVEQEEKEERAEKHRDENFKSPPQKKSIIDSLKTSYTIKKVNDPDNVIFKIENFFKYIWLVIFLLYIIKPAAYRLQKLKDKVRFRWQKEEGSINLPSDGLFTRKMSIFHSVLPYMPRIRYSLKSIRSLFAMNYYKIGQCLSVVTLLINILILLAKKDDVMKSYHDPFYEMFLYLLSRLHLLLSFISIVSFCYLKVPLIIFKKEKEVVRKLENHGDVKKTLPHLTALDRVVIKSSNFPRKFWDKQIKDRILSRCSPELYPKMAAVLGVETRSKFEPLTRYQELTKLMKSIIDIRYFLWCVAVIFNDMDFLYKLCYCVTGFIGTFYNVFFFSILLLDLMLRSKILMTVLRALLINSKQLMVTLALTAVVIYIYTVIAYNYFRKFYIRELEPGFVRDDCNNMLTCFLFHLDQGVRSGGGIADVILSAFDDQQYSWRLVFDLSFYFFVIVILIALFQGLIIDAFGELRKKDDTILDELKNKCFICGISKTDFDSPHKFDVHTHTHHSMKNYMFFLMHLIGKPETEFTGQESYVWDQYLQERWDFFPAGTCFQMQENERQKKLKTTPKRQRYLRPLSHANTIAKIEY
jgi:Ca2+-binding EF-hand superfamily protein